MPDRWRFVLITLAALIGVAITLSLGRWQLQRAAYKQQLFDAVQRQQGLPPLDNAQLAPMQPGAALNTEAAPWLHRPVRLQGHWIAGQSLYLDNRQMQGQPGFFVLTPLRLAAPHEDVVITVQRGWVPRNFLDRTALPEVQTPEGLVTVEGAWRPRRPGSTNSAVQGQTLMGKSRASDRMWTLPNGPWPPGCRCANGACCRPAKPAKACGATGPL